jgi:hypothetical protein
MMNVWTFDSVRMRDVLIFWFIESNFQTFAICLFFIAEFAVKSWIIANPLKVSHPLKLKWMSIYFYEETCAKVN